MNSEESSAPLGYGWLTGAEIARQCEAGRITIEPFDCASLNPNSYNYTLGATLRRITNEVIDLRGTDTYEEIELPREGQLLLPGELYLGGTAERFGSPVYASLITGRSSVGRKFVTNHVTAGLIDVGFFGHITLEIMVARKTMVYPGISFGQIYWFTVAGQPNLYAGKYQGQVGPTLSRLAWDIVAPSDIFQQDGGVQPLQSDT